MPPLSFGRGHGLSDRSRLRSNQPPSVKNYLGRQANETSQTHLPNNNALQATTSLAPNSPLFNTGQFHPSTRPTPPHHRDRAISSGFLRRMPIFRPARGAGGRRGEGGLVAPLPDADCRAGCRCRRGGGWQRAGGGSGGRRRAPVWLGVAGTRSWVVCAEVPRSSRSPTEFVTGRSVPDATPPRREAQYA